VLPAICRAVLVDIAQVFIGQMVAAVLDEDTHPIYWPAVVGGQDLSEFPFHWDKKVDPVAALAAFLAFEIFVHIFPQIKKATGEHPIAFRGPALWIMRITCFI